jgi:hypothetical protein
MIVQIVKQSSTFYGTRRFIRAFEKGLRPSVKFARMPISSTLRSCWTPDQFSRLRTNPCRLSVAVYTLYSPSLNVCKLRMSHHLVTMDPHNMVPNTHR